MSNLTDMLKKYGSWPGADVLKDLGARVLPMQGVEWEYIQKPKPILNGARAIFVVKVTCRGRMLHSLYAYADDYRAAFKTSLTSGTWLAELHLGDLRDGESREFVVAYQSHPLDPPGHKFSTVRVRERWHVTQAEYDRDLLHDIRAIVERIHKA